MAKEDRFVPNMMAPNFRAIAYGGNIIDTRELRGKKIWLVFYRYAACPLCCLHLSNVVKNQAALRDLNIRMLVVFESPIGTVTSTVCGTHSALFPMIPDPRKDLYRLFRTERRPSAAPRFRVLVSLIKARFSGFKQGAVEGDFDQIPAHFLIDESGVIKVAYYGKAIDDHLPWKTVEAFSKLPSPFEIGDGYLSNDSANASSDGPSKDSSVSSEEGDGVEFMDLTKSTEIERTRGTDIWKKFGNR